MTNNQKRTIHDFFREYIPTPDRWNTKTIIEIADDFTVSELLSLYKENEWYNEYFMELWAVSDEIIENRFLLNVEYTKENSFVIAYSYPLDKKENRNFYTEISRDATFDLPVKDVKIFKVEFYNRNAVDWDFVPSNIKYPRLDFVLADINACKRFGKSGICSSSWMSRFRIIDAENKRCVYTIEYNKTNDTFELRTDEGSFPFECTFQDRWYYFYQGTRMDDIVTLFDLVQQSIVE